MSIKINHVAVVVPKLEEAMSFWTEGIGLQVSKIQEVESEQVRIAFLQADNAKIELVEPIEGESSVSRFLDKRGSGIHHVCFDVDDLESAIQHLLAQGVELINEEPRVRDGMRYIFIHPRSTGGVLVELYEK